MDEAMLRADCAQCEGLCCVGLAFDRSELFAYDKPAGVACRHLTSCGACSIHDDLAAHGFAGCVRYDCFGAGQRVSREMFPGRSWKESAGVARAMFDALRAMRQVHELLLLLREAGGLRLSPCEREERAALMLALQPAEGWTPQGLRAFERGRLGQDVRAFLASLRAAVAMPRP